MSLLSFSLYIAIGFSSLPYHSTSMAPPGLLSLCVLILVVMPHRAYGSGRGPFGRKNGAATTADSGICATSVTIYGYKCEEHEVRASNKLVQGKCVWYRILVLLISCIWQKSMLTKLLYLRFQVTTQDGFILNMQRIPEGRVGGNSTGGNKKQPVLIQHGVLVVSA